MRRSLAAAGFLASLILLPASASHAAPAAGACEQITQICKSAGFVQGAASSGNGLVVDCIEPIMQGAASGRRAGRPVPAVDPNLVAACRAQDPGFGASRGRGGAGAASAAAPAQPAAPLPKMVPQPRSQPDTRPNIVFILTDDLSLNLVQFMPHVQEMQRRGASFANYFVTDSLCCPSRSSIFTGRFPHDTGVYKNTGEDGGYLAFLRFGHESATFAVSLAAAGYRTAMLGKYLNGYEPAKHAPAPGWTGWAVAGGAGYAEFNYALSLDGKVTRYGATAADYMTDVLSETAQRFIKQSGNTPFFIEIATFAPHAPYIPAPRDANAFPGLRAPRTPAYNAAPDANAPPWLKSHRALSDADMAKIDKDFRMRAQSVLAVDKMIGELQAAVAAIGQEKNTYFVFSSDNGYHMGEHQMMPGKMTAFDTDIHVPLVMTGPQVPAGRSIAAIAENIDLCPTFAEIAGARPPPAVDGRSLLPLLQGREVPEWRTVALIEHRGPHTDRSDPDAPAERSGNPTTYEAIRMVSSVYVEYADGVKEYHDLASDPDELRNTFAALPGAEKTALAQTLRAMVNCRDAPACWAAARPAHLAQRQ